MTAPVPGPLTRTEGAAQAAQELVTEVTAQLAQLREQPVEQHVAVFDAVHRRLQDALATLDEA